MRFFWTCLLSVFLCTALGESLLARNDSISLRECLKASRENAIIRSRYSVVADISDLKKSNAAAGNLPSVSAYGKAWYQSDAIAIEFPGGMGLEVDPFQYNTGIEVNQKLYDGGLSGRTKNLETANFEVQTSRLDAELYRLNVEVTELFFQALLLMKKTEVLQLKEETLNRRIVEMQSAVAEGLISENELEKDKS